MNPAQPAAKLETAALKAENRLSPQRTTTSLSNRLSV